KAASFRRLCQRDLGPSSQTASRSTASPLGKESYSQKADDHHGPGGGLGNGRYIGELERARARGEAKASNLMPRSGVSKREVTIAIGQRLASSCLHCVANDTRYRRS